MPSIFLFPGVKMVFWVIHYHQSLIVIVLALTLKPPIEGEKKKQTPIAYRVTVWFTCFYLLSYKYSCCCLYLLFCIFSLHHWYIMLRISLNVYKYYKRQLFNLCILGISEILFFDVKGDCCTSWKLCTCVCVCVCIYTYIYIYIFWQ